MASTLTRCAAVLAVLFETLKGTCTGLSIADATPLAVCHNLRIDSIETVRSEVAAWQARRDHLHAKVNWQFTTENSRIKLKRLYSTTTS